MQEVCGGNDTKARIRQCCHAETRLIRRIPDTMRTPFFMQNACARGISQGLNKDRKPMHAADQRRRVRIHDFPLPGQRISRGHGESRDSFYSCAACASCRTICQAWGLTGITDRRQPRLSKGRSASSGCRCICRFNSCRVTGRGKARKKHTSTMYQRGRSGSLLGS